MSATIKIAEQFGSQCSTERSGWQLSLLILAQVAEHDVILDWAGVDFVSSHFVEEMLRVPNEVYGIARVAGKLRYINESPQIAVVVANVTQQIYQEVGK